MHDYPIAKGSHLHRLLTQEDVKLGLGIKPIIFQFRIRPVPFKRVVPKVGKPYNPREYREYKELIQKSALQQYSGPTLRTTLRVDCFFFFDSGHHGDRDNLGKAIEDALQYDNDKDHYFRGIYHNDKSNLAGSQEIFYKSEHGDDWPGFEGSLVIITRRNPYSPLGTPLLEQLMPRS